MGRETDESSLKTRDRDMSTACASPKSAGHSHVPQIDAGLFQTLAEWFLVALLCADAAEASLTEPASRRNPQSDEQRRTLSASRN